MKAGAVQELLKSHMLTREDADAGAVCLVLSALPVILTSDDARDEFSAADGVGALHSVLDRWAGGWGI